MLSFDVRSPELPPMGAALLDPQQVISLSPLPRLEQRRRHHQQHAEAATTTPLPPATTHDAAQRSALRSAQLDEAIEAMGSMGSPMDPLPWIDDEDDPHDHLHPTHEAGQTPLVVADAQYEYALRDAAARFEETRRLAADKASLEQKLRDLRMEVEVERAQAAGRQAALESALMRRQADMHSKSQLPVQQQR